jgi:hypothetical protein
MSRSESRWFGKSWHAPVNHPDYEIPIPQGEECSYCGIPFNSESQGVKFSSDDQFHENCLSVLIVGPEVAAFIERCRSAEAGEEQQEAGHG